MFTTDVCSPQTIDAGNFDNRRSLYGVQILQVILLPSTSRHSILLTVYMAGSCQPNRRQQQTWRNLVIAQLLHLPRRRLLPHRRQSVFYVRRMNSTRFVLTFYLLIFFIILREIVTASAVVVSTLAVITTAFTNKQVNRVLLLPIMFHKPPTIYWTKEIFIQIARVIGPPGASLSSKTIDNGMPLA